MGKDEGVLEWLRIKESSPIRMVARGPGAHRKKRYARLRVPVSDSLQSKKRAPDEDSRVA
jgi:hypothetical protein